MMNHSDEFLRKAAILIATLDDHAAETLLDQFNRQQAAQLQGMLQALLPPDASEQEQVVREFLQSARRSPGTLPETDGVEVDESLARRIAAEPVPDPGIESESLSAAEELPFGFLVGETPESLAALLAEEHPQTISLVLAHLPPAVATGVLRQLPAARRSEILQRLTNLAQTDERLVAEVERELKRVIARRLRLPGPPPVGWQLVRAMLDAADAPERDMLLNHLHASGSSPAVLQDSGSDHPLGARKEFQEPEEWTAGPNLELAPAAAERDSSDLSLRLAHPGDAGLPLEREKGHTAAANGQDNAWEFGDLVRLDDYALARVLRAVDPQVALLALAGAPTALVERILKPASSRESRAWRAQLERLGPLRLSDVECAQRQMAEAAGRLADQGLITSVRRRPLARIA